MPIIDPDAQAEEKLGALREQLRSFGRDPAKFGIEVGCACTTGIRNAGQRRQTAGGGSAPT
jgi:hypothetical protein